MTVLRLSKPLKEQYARVSEQICLYAAPRMPTPTLPLDPGAQSRCGTAPGLVQLQGDVQDGHDLLGGGA